MSTNTQVAVLASLRRDAGPRRSVARANDRPIVRLVAFAALGLYGVTRWGTLMHPASTPRLLGLLAISLALAGIAPVLLERERTVAAMRGHSEPLSAVGAPLAFIAILAAFPISGVPLDWTIHLRVGATANGIGQGLSALPGILVPYNGINDWVRTVILLGAAVLLLDAAMLLAFAPPALGDIRRAGAALPLIALVVVPATLVHPSLPYLHGLLLFALIALFMWGERVPSDRRGGVLLACAVTGAVGMVIGPALKQSTSMDRLRGADPRLHARARRAVRLDPAVRAADLAAHRQHRARGEVRSDSVERRVLEDREPRLVRWRGVGRGRRHRGPGSAEQRAARRKRGDDQALHAEPDRDDPRDEDHADHRRGVRVGASAPVGLAACRATASAPGRARVNSVPETATPCRCTPRIRAPPSSRDAGTDYPSNIRQQDLELTMPQNPPGDQVLPQRVVFPTFHSKGAGPQDQTDPRSFSGASAIHSSPYWPVYNTAQSLVRTSKTPYAYVQKVMGYLTAANGFSYDEYPPPTADPLVTFLSLNHLGYCQQFAGSMALLLRMGGIPARVVTGFTSGSYDSTSQQWLVTDVDAHAWVEAWFPHYGWVSFDPTPAAAPARGGRTPITATGSFNSEGELTHPNLHVGHATGASGTTTTVHSSSSLDTVLLATLGVLAVLLAIALFAWRRTAPLGPDDMLAELERALGAAGVRSPTA